jgi:hypothetical protein
MKENRTGKRRESRMELWLILAFIGVWFALQLWILPKMGVKT